MLHTHSCCCFHGGHCKLASVTLASYLPLPSYYSTVGSHVAQLFSNQIMPERWRPLRHEGCKEQHVYKSFQLTAHTSKVTAVSCLPFPTHIRLLYASTGDAVVASQTTTSSHANYGLMSWQLCSHTITVRCYIQTDFQSRPRIGPSRPGNEISQELTPLVADQLHLVIHVQLQLLVSVFVQLTSVGTVTSDTGCPRKTFTYLLLLSEL